MAGEGDPIEELRGILREELPEIVRGELKNFGPGQEAAHELASCPDCHALVLPGNMEEHQGEVHSTGEPEEQHHIVEDFLSCPDCAKALDEHVNNRVKEAIDARDKERAKGEGPDFPGITTGD